MAQDHGNLNTNEKPHHLYEIRDSVDDDVFKYSISHDPIGADGLSKRIRVQVNFLNTGVDWRRFFARILLLDILGRKAAKRIETEHIAKYKEENGRRPRGNKED